MNAEEERALRESHAELLAALEKITDAFGDNIGHGAIWQEARAVVQKVRSLKALHDHAREVIQKAEAL